MSNLNYSLKVKCQGCKALQTGSEFTCLFGLPLSHEEDSSGNHIQPAPNEVKCYKPKTSADLKQAKILMEKRFAEQAPTHA